MSGEPAATDRGMWRVVAARDFWVRLRDKGFVISTMITLSVLSVFILIRAYTGGPIRSSSGTWGTAWSPIASPHSPTGAASRSRWSASTIPAGPTTRCETGASTRS